jgi:hypothetical protein
MVRWSLAVSPYQRSHRTDAYVASFHSGIRICHPCRTVGRRTWPCSPCPTFPMRPNPVVNRTRRFMPSPWRPLARRAGYANTSNVRLSWSPMAGVGRKRQFDSLARGRSSNASCWLASPILERLQWRFHPRACDRALWPLHLETGHSQRQIPRASTAGGGREPRFRKFAVSRRSKAVGGRRRAAMRRPPPQAVTGQERKLRQFLHS